MRTRLLTFFLSAVVGLLLLAPGAQADDGPSSHELAGRIAHLEHQLERMTALFHAAHGGDGDGHESCDKARDKGHCDKGRCEKACDKGGCDKGRCEKACDKGGCDKGRCEKACDKGGCDKGRCEKACDKGGCDKGRCEKACDKGGCDKGRCEKACDKGGCDKGRCEKACDKGGCDKGRCEKACDKGGCDKGRCEKACDKGGCDKGRCEKACDKGGCDKGRCEKACDKGDCDEGSCRQRGRLARVDVAVDQDVRSLGVGLGALSAFQPVAVRAPSMPSAVATVIPTAGPEAAIERYEEMIMEADTDAAVQYFLSRIATLREQSAR